MIVAEIVNFSWQRNTYNLFQTHAWLWLVMQRRNYHDYFFISVSYHVNALYISVYQSYFKKLTIHSFILNLLWKRKVWYFYGIFALYLQQVWDFDCMIFVILILSMFDIPRIFVLYISRVSASYFTNPIIIFPLILSCEGNHLVYWNHPHDLVIKFLASVALILIIFLLVAIRFNCTSKHLFILII